MFATVALVMWIGCCVLLGWLAKHKGREATHWIALALLLSLVLFIEELATGIAANQMERALWAVFLAPWLPVLVVAFLPNHNRKRCPDCGETIQASAAICRFCRHAFDQAARLPGNLART